MMLLPDLIACPINFTMLAAPVPLHALESLRPLCPCVFWRACGLCALAWFGALCPCMFWRACGPCALACNACGLCAVVWFGELAAPAHLNIAHQTFYEGPKKLWTEGLKNLMNLRAQDFLWAWASNKNTAKQDMSMNLRPPKFHEPKIPTHYMNTRHHKSYSMNRRHQKKLALWLCFFGVARFFGLASCTLCRLFSFCSSNFVASAFWLSESRSMFCQCISGGGPSGLHFLRPTSAAGTAKHVLPLWTSKPCYVFHKIFPTTRRASSEIFKVTVFHSPFCAWVGE